MFTMVNKSGTRVFLLGLLLDNALTLYLRVLDLRAIMGSCLVLLFFIF